jgi:hypothetical protein
MQDEEPTLWIQVVLVPLDPSISAQKRWICITALWTKIFLMDRPTAHQMR